MSSKMSWEDFLTEALRTFRQEFDKLTSEEQKRIREERSEDLLLEPCQIEVLDYGEEERAIWLVIHENQFPDMTFKIHKDVKSIDASEFVAKYKHEFSMLSDLSVEQLRKDKQIFPEDLLARIGLSIFTKNTAHFFVKGVISPQIVVDSFLRTARGVLKSEQVDVIERSTDGLKKTIAKIPEKAVRDELLATTRRIDRSLQEIRRLDEEIGKVRQLVGITKEIQDWKLLISDVDRLKGEHVPREVFDAKVNELTTRLDSLSEIREAYDKVLAQQTKVIEQQSGFIKWIKYATILLPIAVISVPIIEIVSIWLCHFLGIS